MERPVHTVLTEHPCVASQTTNILRLRTWLEIMSFYHFIQVGLNEAR